MVSPLPDAWIMEAVQPVTRSRGVPLKVLMPWDLTLPTGNRSSAESSTVFTYCRVFTALGPGMTALCRAA